MFFAGGRAPAPGDAVRAAGPRAGRCATSPAEGPDLFYRGRVAQAIAERMATEGFLTPDDLAGAPR